LPAGRLGAFLLLVLVAFMSAVLDNIAAPLIGGTVARTVFRGKVHIGYLAAVVAASNAGGAGSVLGDTTTTMIWIEGVSPLLVAEAAIGAVAALLFFGWFAARQQHELQPLVKIGGNGRRVDVVCLAVVLLILASAIAANVAFGFPAVGVWAALLLGALVRKPAWNSIPAASLGAVSLVSLVLAASMMLVKSLPEPSRRPRSGSESCPPSSTTSHSRSSLSSRTTTTGTCWRSASVTVVRCCGSAARLAIAIAGLFPQAKSTRVWLANGWHVAVGYVLGFLAMMVLTGWNASPIPRSGGNDEPARMGAPTGAPSGR
jgi:hypothetical protein